MQPHGPLHELCDGLGLATGRVLIEQVYAYTQTAGLARVCWLTHESNKDATLLHDNIAGPACGTSVPFAAQVRDGAYERDDAFA